MADKHPYVSGTGVLVQVLDHLKRSFPQKLDADVLKKLGFAPKNESYIINIVRFLKLIDETGARTEKAQKIFTLHDDATFQKAFADAVKAAYTELFSLHGDAAWNLDGAKLVTFFRQANQSSALVGTRQAGTFKTLAAYAGHGEPVQPAKPRNATARSDKTERKQAQSGKGRSGDASRESGKQKANVRTGPVTSNQDVKALGLTVRIEINLPATGDQDTYDKIFKSIRENLLNG